ncbi:hypothetical protein DENIS_0942 [Desulfonema ishimotonii]|uniref:Uncharacterized protein n=1 Tax=Desulfonema ishimotonii TaxID=45657 RepID=A0A401FSS8_9BACT|nr:hypothetical protein DENIS_0942 [Desulfonema ishimotonii]
MHLETRGYSGARLERRIAFSTNDPRRQRFELTLTGDVVMP